MLKRPAKPDWSSDKWLTKPKTRALKSLLKPLPPRRLPKGAALVAAEDAVVAIAQAVADAVVVMAIAGVVMIVAARAPKMVVRS